MTPDEKINKRARMRELLDGYLEQAYEEGRVAAFEDAAVVALEQRGERGTPWDTACMTIAAKIRERALLTKGVGS